MALHGEHLETMKTVLHSELQDRIPLARASLVECGRPVVAELLAHPLWMLLPACAVVRLHDHPMLSLLLADAKYGGARTPVIEHPARRLVILLAAKCEGGALAEVPPSYCLQGVSAHERAYEVGEPPEDSPRLH